jgi:hypothetical protein
MAPRRRGYVPVCNRGNTTAAAGAVLYVFPGNSTHFPSCTPATSTATARCVVPTAIAPGACVDVTEANCTQFQGGGAVLMLSGNKSVMINPPIGTAAGQVAECHCSNNWSDYHSGGCQTGGSATYSTLVYKQTYTSSCPAGTRVRWGYLAYTTTTPGDSSVKFQAHTGPSASSLAASLTTLATAKTATNTSTCSMGGPIPCPVDVYAALALPAATEPVLELVMTLTPSTGGASAPTLVDWQLTYSCPPSE